MDRTAVPTWAAGTALLAGLAAAAPATRDSRPGSPEPAPPAAAAAAPTTRPARREVKRELLARHEAVVRYAGTGYVECGGLTTACPDRCGSSGDYARFEVLAYLAYERPSESGDRREAAFTAQVRDNRGRPGLPPEQAELVRSLRPGDHLRLGRRHDDVTYAAAAAAAGAGGGSWPERPITRLERLTPEQAGELVRAASAAAATTAPAARPGPARRAEGVVRSRRGDDLRATPDRCPECGAVPAARRLAA